MKLAKLNNGEYVDLNFAHKVIKENCKEATNNWGKKEIKFFSTSPRDSGLTTSKLRGLMDLVNQVYTKVYNNPNPTLSEEIKDELEYLKVKFAYEAGREPAVREFVNKTLISQLLDRAIKKNSKKFFLDYCKYFEALVAYAKFYKMGD